ncbi:hypothetical protein ACXYTJ_14560 [Gilvimarinus sp. F26214L]|uniref:hypothetical protein n=1 Tax=Gilvimarinus sp. DZF01 TaxID=3461371 RepID=UPI0040458EF9
MKKSGIIAGTLVGTFLVSAIVEARWPLLAEAALVTHVFVIAFMLYWWVGQHALEQGLTSPPAGAKLSAALIAPIGLAYYFYRGYGFQSGTIKLMLAIVLFVLSSVLYMVPFYVVQWLQT